MSLSSLPGSPRRPRFGGARRLGAALAVTALPFTMVACAEDEAEEPGIVEEGEIEEPLEGELDEEG